MLKIISKAFIFMVLLSICTAFKFAKTNNKITELVKVNARKRFVTALIKLNRRFPIKVQKEQPKKNVCIKTPTSEEINIAKQLKRLRKNSSEHQIKALQKCEKISDAYGRNY